MGLDLVLRLYGLPIFLVPLVLIYLLWQAWKSASPDRIVIAAFAGVGMALMVYQFRFHYFGYTFLLLGAVAMIAQLLSRLRLKPRVGGLALAAGVVALQGPALHSLAQLPAPGADVIWFHLPQVIRPLANRCRQDGGVVLADQNLGHYLRWGTECSVIGSNLMMGPADFEAISRGNALLRANLSQAAHSGIDYVVAGDWPRIFGDSGKQPWPLERVLLDLPAGAGAGELPTQQVPLIRVFEVPND